MMLRLASAGTKPYPDDAHRRMAMQKIHSYRKIHLNSQNGV
jgi:hypothetical protein